MKLIVLLMLTTSLVCAEGVGPRHQPHRELKEVTHEQFIQRAEDRFAAIDTDSNGVLSVAEREAARSQHRERMRERIQERVQDRREQRQERRNDRE